jgi:hypothetical protein
MGGSRGECELRGWNDEEAKRAGGQIGLGLTSSRPCWGLRGPGYTRGVLEYDYEGVKSRNKGKDGEKAENESIGYAEPHAPRPRWRVARGLEHGLLSSGN